MARAARSSYRVPSVRSEPVGTVAAMTSSQPSSAKGSFGLPVVISAVCGILIGIAVFLPWFQFAGLSAISGIDTKRQGIETSDGKFILALAVIGLVVLLIARGRRWSSIVQLVLAVIIAAVAFADISNPVTGDGVAAQIVKDNIDILAGLWIIAFAGVIWAVMAIITIVRPVRPATAAPVEWPSAD